MEKYGRLTLVRRDGAWCWCTCDHGGGHGRDGELKFRWQSVRRGETASCGCLRAQKLSARSLKPISEGTVFGRLTVKTYAGKRCLCTCVCRNEVWVDSTHLRTGHTTSCGCFQKDAARQAAIKKVDVGTHYGKLTVISQEGKFCRCSCECGVELTVKTIKLRNGHVKSCGCLRVEQALKMSAEKVMPSAEVAFNSLYAQYKIQASTRHLVFELDKIQFKTATQQACFYCGAPPGQVKRYAGSVDGYVYNGLDRRDNALGYTLDNTVPCCWRCNSAKHTQSESSFLDWVKCVASYADVPDTQTTPIAAVFGSWENALWHRYANSARKRKKRFDLTKQDFVQLISRPCSICGRPPHRRFKHGSVTRMYTGIDRNDNALDYVENNVHSCCWDCSNAKGVGTVDDLKEWAIRVFKHKYAHEQCQPTG